MLRRSGNQHVAVESPMHRRAECTLCLPLGADSPYQGEMSRRDKEGRDSCRRSRLMRRSVVRSEMLPRFRASKAPLGDQGELSAKLTERIRTLLFWLYQRRNVADRRIRILRIRIGTVRFAAPLLRNSSVAFGDSSFYTKEPLDGANAQYLRNFRSPPHPALRATFPSRGRLWGLAPSKGSFV